MRELLRLVLTFAKIGSFTFGGGYAMLSMIQKEIVEKYGWATKEEILDYYAIGQCTPGVIAVNTATFIGYKQKGVPGAIAATFGIVLPSFVIISVIAMFINHFLEYEVVRHCFNGIRVAASVLVINAVWGMGKTALVDKICVVIAVISMLLSLLFSLSPIWVVLAAAAAGLLIKRKGNAA